MAVTLPAQLWRPTLSPASGPPRANPLIENGWSVGEGRLHRDTSHTHRFFFYNASSALCCGPACWCGQLQSPFQFLVTPGTLDRQTPLSLSFFRQEYCSGLPFPTPGGASFQGSDPHLLCPLHWQDDPEWMTKNPVFSSNILSSVWQ